MAYSLTLAYPAFWTSLFWYDALFQIKPSWECYWLWSWECECAEWSGNENVCLITQQIPSHVRGSIQCFYSVLSMSMITLQCWTNIIKIFMFTHKWQSWTDILVSVQFSNLSKLDMGLCLRYCLTMFSIMIFTSALNVKD